MLTNGSLYAAILLVLFPLGCLASATVGFSRPKTIQWEQLQPPPLETSTVMAR